MPVRIKTGKGNQLLAYPNDREYITVNTQLAEAEMDLKNAIDPAIFITLARMDIEN
jgi:hypothetical protein